MSRLAQRILLLALVLLWVGCSASDPAEERPRVRSTAAASSETTATFGITQWVIDADDTHGVVRGVDASDAVVAQFDGLLDRASGNKRGVVTSASEGTGALRFTVRADGNVVVDEGADGKLTRARAMAQHAMKDITRASSSQRLATAGTRPLDSLTTGGPIALSIRDKCAACLIALLCYISGDFPPESPSIEGTGTGTVACGSP